MQVFDLTELRSVITPPETFAETAHYSVFGSAHNIVINEDSGFAYGVGTNTCSGGLHMVNIQNPLLPTNAGCFSSDGYTHDAQCVNYVGPDPDHQGAEVCFNANEDTLTIVDVTNKTAPAQLSRTGYSGSGYTHQGWVTPDHAYFLLDDELDESSFGHNTRTRVWDITDLDAPVLIGFDVGTTPAIDHNQYVHQGYTYQANYRSGLRILDLTGIATASLTEAAFFDIYPSSDSPSFNGAWSVYPYFDSGVAVVSGIEQGLFILQPDLQNNSPAINLAKTVGTDPGICAATNSIAVTAGTDVYYCYEVTNTGTLTLGLHTLIDDQLGPIFTAFSYDLAPGASIDTFAAGLTISTTITNTTVNSAVWTAYNPGPADVVSATASATVDLFANLQVAHLAPFAMDPGTAVTITLDGAPVLTNFAFADSTGYLPVAPGSYLVEITPAGSPTPAISGTVVLAPNQDYTALAVGDGTNQPLGLLALLDDNTAPAPGNFKLRLGHLAPFAPGLATADIRLQDGTPVLTGVSYADIYSGYLELPAGTYDLKITTPGGASTLIDPLPVYFGAGDIFSAFAVGDGTNQPLGVFALPAGSPGFLLPTGRFAYLPLVPKLAP
jgi:choice-of-anchor B domain-containing protein